MRRNYLIPTYTAAVCMAGAVGVHVPAQALPSPDCDWTIQSTGSKIDFSGHSASIEWGLNNTGEATFDGFGVPRNDVTGPVIIKGTNELDFSIHQSEWIRDNTSIPAFTNHYGGSIDPGGTASGTWNNDQGGSGTWSMTKTFQCISNKPAAAPPPVEKAPPPPDEAPPPVEAPPTNKVVMTISKPGLLSPTVNVNITSTASIPGHCTYNAQQIGGPFGHDEEFDIRAMGKKTLTPLAPLPGQTYHVVLSCRGDFKGQDVEFGHQEQNFP